MGGFEGRKAGTAGKTGGETKKYFSYAAAAGHSLKGEVGPYEKESALGGGGHSGSGRSFGRWRWEGRASTAAAIRDASGVRWIIDAGHGGEDGGAVSPGGVVESRINLEIARRVDGIFGFCGEPALMLRTEDISLHDPEAVSLREKKASDLHNRAGTALSYPEATLLSVHQNMFHRGWSGRASSRTTAGRASPSRTRCT